MLARHREHPRVGTGTERECHQLILRAEIAPLQPGDVLRIPQARAVPAGVAEHGADACVLQRANERIAVLGRVVDLRHVDDAGRAHFDHAERGGQHSDIGIVRGVGGRELADDVAVVVRIDAAVRQDVAQYALIGMAVRVDEARDDDPVRRIDDCRGVGRDRDVGPDLADLTVLDQHVGLCEVADLPIEGEDHAAFQQDSALRLQAVQLRIEPADDPAPPRRRAALGLRLHLPQVPRRP